MNKQYQRVLIMSFASILVLSICGCIKPPHMRKYAGIWYCYESYIDNCDTLLMNENFCFHGNGEGSFANTFCYFKTLPEDSKWYIHSHDKDLNYWSLSFEDDYEIIHLDLPDTFIAGDYRVEYYKKDIYNEEVDTMKLVGKHGYFEMIKTTDFSY